ncbi:MAG TPA: hypothetical protein VMT72_02350 [Pseudolabrys sp.]|nr:hypothetical protein [Pseudolabrys sp.]
MRDRPSNNRKMVGPSSGRLESIKLTGECTEPVPDDFPITKCDFLRDIGLKRMPVLVSIVRVTDLSSHHSPQQPMISIEAARSRKVVRQRLAYAFDVVSF